MVALVGCQKAPRPGYTELPNVVTKRKALEKQILELQPEKERKAAAAEALWLADTAFKASAAIPRIYRVKYGRDIFKDLMKLEKALKVFSCDPTGVVAMDLGASTGGFTDVLLQNGAAHVYSIDVGFGQLDWKIRNDERVTVMERTNARAITVEMFETRPTLAVMDVSFISIKLILPAAMQVLGETFLEATAEQEVAPAPSAAAGRCAGSATQL